MHLDSGTELDAVVVERMTLPATAVVLPRRWETLSTGGLAYQQDTLSRSLQVGHLACPARFRYIPARILDIISKSYRVPCMLKCSTLRTCGEALGLSEQPENLSRFLIA